MLNNRLPDSYIIQEGVQLGYMMSQPLYIDTTNNSNIYLGYGQIGTNLDKPSTLLICKININGSIITKYYAYGAWDDRATLEYK